MNPLKKLAAQTATYGVSSIIGRVLNYFLVPLYTHPDYFTPGQYGIVTELYAYVALLIVFLTFGMETAFFRFAKEKKDIKGAFQTALTFVSALSLLFLIVITALSGKISTVLHIPSHTEYIVWFAIVIALDAFTSLPFAWLRQQDKAKRFATIKLIGIGVNIGLNLFFIVGCSWLHKNGYHFIDAIYNPNIGVGYIFIANLASSAITFLLLFPEWKSFRPSFQVSLFKPMLRYAAPLVIIGSAGIINETLDRILLEYLLPLSPAEIKAEIGIYGACYKLSIIMSLAIQAFRYAAEPFFFEQSSKASAQDTYAAVMHFFTAVLSVIFLATMMYIDIIKYFIGPAFHEGLAVVPILLLANLLLGVYYNLSIWYKLTDKTRLGAYVPVAGALITIGFNIWWIPTLGYIGSAWATLICYAFMAVVSYLMGQYYYPVNYNLKKILFYIIGAVGLYLFSDWLSLTNPLMMYAVNTVLLLVFTLMIWRIENPKRLLKPSAQEPS